MTLVAGQEPIRVRGATVELATLSSCVAEGSEQQKGVNSRFCLADGTEHLSAATAVQGFNHEGCLQATVSATCCCACVKDCLRALISFSSTAILVAAGVASVTS